MSGEKPLPLPEELPGEMRTLGGGLSIDLVPRSAGNLKLSLSPYKWKRLSKGVRQRAGWKCEACGKESSDPQHADTTCHERWVWHEESGWQRLTRLMALCLKCDAVTHFHHHASQRGGDVDELLEHLATVRGWSLDEARAHLREQEEVWERRSGIRWLMDRNLLVPTGLIAPEDAVEDKPQLWARMTRAADGTMEVEISEDAEAQAAFIESCEEVLPHDQLFGRDEERFCYVAYETAGRWVGIVREPFWVADADSLEELEECLVWEVAEEAGVPAERVRLYSQLLTADSVEETLIDLLK